MSPDDVNDAERRAFGRHDAPESPGDVEIGADSPGEGSGPFAGASGTRGRQYDAAASGERVREAVGEDEGRGASTTRGQVVIPARARPAVVSSQRRGGR